MCFNWQMSFAFTGLAVGVAFLMHRKFPDKPGLPAGVLYFGVMELLQGLTLAIPGVISNCDNPVNKILTLLGIAHICFQPYVIHRMSGSFVKPGTERAGMSKAYQRLALWAGVFLLLTGLLGPSVLQEAYTRADIQCLNNHMVVNDWIRGPELCSKQGLYHLVWTMPLRAPSYWLPNSFIHFFVMFMPYFCESHSVFTGLLFVVTGPGLAALITSNIHEQASIWCFFSILQICLICGRLLLPRRLQDKAKQQ